MATTTSKISCVWRSTNDHRGRLGPPEGLPQMKFWRCNLTALASSFNLYFVACVDEVHVYQPSFPAQALANEPDLVLYPPKSSPVLGPQIDMQDPHSITRLLVGYLGNEEVLLITCDDGDVLGFRVSHIQRHLDECGANQEEHAHELNILPFLHRNVGASAWGLSIHREARLIAISANTHQVTVLAFALSTGGADQGGSASPGSVASDSGEEDDGVFPHLRRKDHVIVMQASSNIPHVTFDNNDKTGRWLYSGSIDGEVHVWDIFNPEHPARTLEIGYCHCVDEPREKPMCECANRTSIPHGVWGVEIIDPQSCLLVDSLQEACGPGLPSEGPVWSSPCFWDITDTTTKYQVRRMKVPTVAGLLGYSTTGGQHNAVQDTHLLEGASASGADEQSDHGDDAGSDAMSLDSDERSVAEADAGTAAEVQDISTEVMPHDENDNDDEMVHNNENVANEENISDSENVANEENISIDEIVSNEENINNDENVSNNGQVEDISEDQLAIAEQTNAHTQTEQSLVVAHYPLQFSPLSSSSDEDDEPAQTGQLVTASEFLLEAFHTYPSYEVQHSFTQPYLTDEKEPYFQTNSSPSISGCAAAQRTHRPCIVISKDEIFLLQRPLKPSADHLDAILAMQSPLYPTRQDPGAQRVKSQQLNYHRQSFVTQIPELGVLIVGSPAGRVGIFRLTKVKDAGATDVKQYCWRGRVPTFGFRREYLLPFVGDRDYDDDDDEEDSEDEAIDIDDVWGKRLVGVAAGPVQGMLDEPEIHGRAETGSDDDEDGGDKDKQVALLRTPESRRWRLFLYFHDHTVYTYELWRPAGKDAPELADLNV